MADGSIRVNTSLNLTGIKRDIKELEKELSKAEKEIADLEASKSKATSEYDDKAENGFGSQQEEAITEQIRAVEEINAQMAEVEAKAEAYREQLAQATAELERQQNLANAGGQLDKAIKDDNFANSITSQEQYNSILSQTEAQMAQIEQRAEEIARATGTNKDELLKNNKTYQELSDKYKILTDYTYKFGKEAKSSGEKAHKGLLKASLSASNFGKSIQRGIGSLKKMALGIFGVRSAFAMFRQAMQAYMADNQQLQGQLDGLKNVMAQAIGPVVEWAIGLLGKAISYVNAFVTALTGINLVAKANASALNKQAKATSNANKAQSASFDEQNKLSDNSSGGGGSGGGTFELDDGAMLDKVKSFGEKVKALWSSGDYFGVGSAFAESLNSAFDKLDVSGAGSKLSTWIKNVLDVGIGFLNTIDLSKVGGAISDAILDFDLEGVGIKAIELVTSFWNAITKFVESIQWKEIGNKISTGLMGVIKNTDWGKVFTSISEFAGSLVGALTGAIVGFLSGIGESIIEAWHGVTDWWKDVAYEDGEFTMQGLLDGIWEKIKNVGNWIKENVFKPFIDGFKKAFGIASPSKVMKEQGGFISQGLIDGIKEKIAKIKELAQQIKQAILDKFNDFATKLKTKFSDAWTAVKNVFSKGGAIFSGIVTGISNVFKTIVNKLIDGINKVVAVPFNAINNMLNKIRNVSVAGIQPFASLWSQNPLTVPSIPKLAKGAIVNNVGRGVPVIAGEAGAEAILPLENNTEWMDILVDKINGGNTTIPIYLDGKQIAKYVIERQKQRAFAMNGA